MEIKIQDMTPVMTRVSEIKPYAQNPRKNAKGVEAVKKSMQEFGVRAPILLDKDGYIIYGHTRWQAAVELGIESYPCIVAQDMTAEAARAYRIADNAVGDFSEWDADKLVLELEALKDFEFKSLPLLDLGLDSFLPLSMQMSKDVNFTAKEGAKEISEGEFQDFNHKCPRCGFEFNDQK